MSYIWQIIFSLFSAFQFPGQECYPQNWLIWPVTDSLEATNWVNNRQPNIICFLETLLTQSFQSVQFSRSVMYNSLQPHGLQHSRLPCLSPTCRACSNSSPLSRWYHATISSSVVPFFFAFNLSQHQGLFQWVSSSHQVTKVLQFQFQHQSFQWIFRTDFL